MSVAEFWALTPRELGAVLDAARWRLQREHERDAWLAWHIAALQRVKRLPDLRRFMGRDKARPLRGAELERRRREHEEIVRRLGGG